MSFQAKITVSGTRVEDSSDALKNAVKVATSSNNLKRHESRLNKHFQENIRNNLRQSGVEADNFDDVLFLRISNGNINFVNTEPLVTQRYEYGYYDSQNYNDEEYYEEYMIQTSPRYFIRPAIQESLNEVGQIITNDVNNEYMRNRRQSHGDEV